MCGVLGAGNEARNFHAIAIGQNMDRAIAISPQDADACVLQPLD
jgi:phage-related baseplate assembly protein